MKKNLLAVALLSAVSASAFAADDGVYVSAALGMTSNIADVDRGMSYSALAGYQFDKNWSVEGGYVSLINKANVKNLGAGVTGKASLSGGEIAGIYNYPLSSQFSVFGRLGYASMTAKAEASSGGITLSSSSNLSGLVAGLGVQYKATEQLGIRAGFNRYNLKNSGSTGETPNNFYAAAVFKF